MEQNFDSFDLATPLKESLGRMKFSTPTPIQAESLPLSLEGKSLVGCAQTGSGKTIAFGLPMIQRLLENPSETGCQLHGLQIDEFPDQILIKPANFDEPVPAQIIWRRRHRAGVTVNWRSGSAT